MKKAIITLALAVATVVSASALTPRQMNGRACYGVVGPVKKVVTHRNCEELNDYTMYFNSNGEFTGWSEGAIKYSGPNAYTKYGQKWRVTYTANTRTDRQVGGERWKIVYTFDKQGRIIKMSSDEEFYQQETHYSYKGDSKFPFREGFGGSEGGVGDDSATTYEYLKFDSHGNWIERRVKGTKLEDSYDEPEIINLNYIETRTITYY